jgi:uncharacterized membrane protein
LTRAILYYHPKDYQVEKLILDISTICQNFNIDFVPLNIEKIDDLSSIKHTPNLTVGPYDLKYPFTLVDVEIAISTASAKKSTEKIENLRKIRKINRSAIFFSKFYPTIIALIILLFVSGSFAAPLLMATGHSNSARIIYGFYRAFCHQLAFRSFFIGGEQLVYPRELANISNLVTYETEFNDPFDNVNFARQIVGDSRSGFKIALCERDLAIYFSLALSAILFQIMSKKNRSIHWYYWVVIGLLPIAIDGFSQIPGLSSGWPNWMIMRESTPALRILTGMLFGGMTGIYIFPLMEESIKDSYNQLIVQREIIRSSEKEIRSHARN